MSVSVINRGGGSGGVEVTSPNGTISFFSPNEDLIKDADVGNFVTLEFDTLETGEFFNNVILYQADGAYGNIYLGVKRTGTKAATLVLFRITNSNTYSSLATLVLNNTILNSNDTDSSGLMYFYVNLKVVASNKIVAVSRNGAQLISVNSSGSGSNATYTLQSQAVQTWTTAFSNVLIRENSFPALIKDENSTSSIVRLAFIYSYYTRSGSSYAHSLAMIPIMVKPSSNAIILQDPVIFKTISQSGTNSPFSFVVTKGSGQPYAVIYDKTESALYQIDIAYPSYNKLTLSYTKIKSLPAGAIPQKEVRTEIQPLGDGVYWYFPTGVYNDTSSTKINSVGCIFSLNSTTTDDKLLALQNQNMTTSSSVAYNIGASSCAISSLGLIYSDIGLFTTYIKYSYYYIFGKDGNTKIINDNSPYKLRGKLSAFSIPLSNSAMLMESRTQTYKLGDYSTGNYYVAFQIPRLVNSEGKQSIGIKTKDTEITLN